MTETLKYLVLCRTTKFRKSDAIISRRAVSNLVKNFEMSELWTFDERQNIYPRHPIRRDGRLEIGRPYSIFYRWLVEQGIKQCNFICKSEKKLSFKEYLKYGNLYEYQKIGKVLQFLFQVKIKLKVMNNWDGGIYESKGYSHIEYLFMLNQKTLRAKIKESFDNAWAKICFSSSVLSAELYLISIYYLTFKKGKFELFYKNYREETYMGALSSNEIEELTGYENAIR